jgi:hypothetical protein
MALRIHLSRRTAQRRRAGDREAFEEIARFFDRHLAKAV